MNVSVNGRSQEMQVNQFKPVMVKEKKPANTFGSLLAVFCTPYPIPSPRTQVFEY